MEGSHPFKSLQYLSVSELCYLSIIASLFFPRKSTEHSNKTTNFPKSNEASIPIFKLMIPACIYIYTNHYTSRWLFQIFLNIFFCSQTYSLAVPSGRGSLCQMNNLSQYKRPFVTVFLYLLFIQNILEHRHHSLFYYILKTTNVLQKVGISLRRHSDRMTDWDLTTWTEKKS